MAKKAYRSPRREESLSLDRIIEASIELLDSSGESGLTFRALSDRLATGPGAIYCHIVNKNDLLAAACDAVVARAMSETVVTTPEATIRAVALSLFDLINEHPWVSSALTSSPGLSPIGREYPFARSVAGQIRYHDDRVDFLAGIDVILTGIKSSSGPSPSLTRHLSGEFR
jgi:AcrR family transcriptional regulator